MTLLERQIELAHSSATLLHGPGTDFVVEGFTPWASGETRTSDIDLATGVAPGVDSEGAAALVATVDFGGVTSELGAQVGLLRSMWQPANLRELATLTYRIGGEDITRFGRPRGVVAVENSDGRFVGAECRFSATDPLMYLAERTEQGDVVTTVGTDGSRPSRCWRIDVGPCIDPLFTLPDAATGEQTVLGFSEDLVISAGWTLTIDAHRRVIYRTQTATGVVQYLTGRKRAAGGKLARLAAWPAGPKTFGFSAGVAPVSDPVFTWRGAR